MAKKLNIIKRETLIDALVWNCPYYTRDGIFSCCQDLFGNQTNCTKETCSRVSNIFKTMAQIEKNEIIVF